MEVSFLAAVSHPIPSFWNRAERSYSPWRLKPTSAPKAFWVSSQTSGFSQVQLSFYPSISSQIPPLSWQVTNCSKGSSEFYNQTGWLDLPILSPHKPLLWANCHPLIERQANLCSCPSASVLLAIPWCAHKPILSVSLHFFVLCVRPRKRVPQYGI